MKKGAYLGFALFGFLLALSSGRGYADDVDMERRMLTEALEKCDKTYAPDALSAELRRHSGNVRIQEDARNTCKKTYQSRLDELNKDPQYYFYKKADRDKKRRRFAIDPETGEAVLVR